MGVFHRKQPPLFLSGVGCGISICAALLSQNIVFSGALRFCTDRLAGSYIQQQDFLSFEEDRE